MEGLESILKDVRARDEQGKFKATDKVETPVVETPESAPTPEVIPEAKVETPAPTAGQKAPEPPEEPAEVRGLKSALMAEKQKRKEYERKSREVEAKLAELQRTPPPDPQQNPEGYAEHYQNMLVDEKVNLSADYAREKHEDYDEVMKGWIPLVTSSPALYQQAITQKFPAEWAYQYMKRSAQMESIGDPDAWMKAKETEIEERLKAKYAKPDIPQPSLANASSAGTMKPSTWSGPPPLKDIFRR